MTPSHHLHQLVAAAWLFGGLGCETSAPPCATNADCTLGEACVLREDGGRCEVRAAANDPAPVAGNHADVPGDDPNDGPSEVPSTPPDDPPAGDVTPRLVSHTSAASAAGAARSASFRITQRIAASPGRALLGGAMEVRD